MPKQKVLKLHETQKEVALDMHRFRVLCCGRRWGKTTLAIDQMKACASIPDRRIAYVAPTYQQARDIAWEQLKDECRNVGVVNESRLEIRLVNGSFIALRGWEAIETLRGQYFNLLVLDEVAMFRDFWLKWQEIIRPTLTDMKGEALFISTPKGFNHFYDLFGMEKGGLDGKEPDPDFKSFHFSTYDNPHMHTEEIEKAKKELTEDRFAQEYMADFRKTEGLVYKEFRREKHIISGEFHDDEMNIIKTIGGVDFGTNSPACALTIKKSGEGVYYVTNEMYKAGMTDSAVADFVATLKLNEVYPDPASKSGVMELEQRGVNVRQVIKGADSVRNGITAVRELFKSNRLMIHASCKMLIWELETYSYPDKKDMQNANENPIKENDHAMDALRYPLMMLLNIEDHPQVQQHRPDWISRKKRSGII